MFAVNHLIGFGAFTEEAAPPSGYSFTMTAGEDSGLIGYSDGVLFTAMGSIDTEPIPGETLRLLFDSSGGSGGMYFAGDLVSLLSGLTVWVDSVEYAFDQTDWTYSGGGDFTAGEWATAGPTFVNTNMYFVEIK